MSRYDSRKRKNVGEVWIKHLIKSRTIRFTSQYVFIQCECLNYQKFTRSKDFDQVLKPKCLRHWKSESIPFCLTKITHVDVKKIEQKMNRENKICVKHSKKNLVFFLNFSIKT